MDNRSEILREILNEADLYISFNHQTLIVGAFDDLFMFLKKNNIENLKSIEKIIISTIKDLLNYGLDINIIVAWILYFPYIYNYFEYKKILNKYPRKTILILDRLYTLDSRFSPYLPWINLEEKEINANLFIDEMDYVFSDKNKNYFWKKRSIDNIPNAYFNFSQEPEIVVLALVYRCNLLRYLRDFNFLDKLPNEKQEEKQEDIKTKIAKESFDLYAVLAEILGLNELKWKIEDYSFRILDSKTYYEISKKLEENREEREKFIKQMIKEISDLLTSKEIEAEVIGRPKHIYSIFRKMQSGFQDLISINDVLGIRIITDTELSCYLTLDVLRENYTLLKDFYENNSDIRDWIVNPKPNGYQSIHTSIKSYGKILEIQIRTQAMNDIAEYGFAAHWIYKKYGNISKFPKNEKYILDTVNKIRQRFEQNLSEE